MRQPRGPVRYGGAYAAPFSRWTTKKEPRRSPRPTALQERIETWFDAGAWSKDLADSYLALGRVDDAVRMMSDATRSGHAGGAEMPCESAEKLMRSGYEPLPGQAPVAAGSRRLPDDVRIYVQAGIGTATSATTPEPWNG